MNSLFLVMLFSMRLFFHFLWHCITLLQVQHLMCSLDNAGLDCLDIHTTTMPTHQTPLFAPHNHAPAPDLFPRPLLVLPPAFSDNIVPRHSTRLKTATDYLNDYQTDLLSSQIHLITSQKPFPLSSTLTYDNCASQYK